MTLGRPPTRPSARAFAKPPMVFSLIVSTRNCANTATIPNRTLPMGVVVSMSGSVRLLMLMLRSPSPVIVWSAIVVVPTNRSSERTTKVSPVRR